MNKKRLLYCLIFSMCFLNSERLVEAQRISESDFENRNKLRTDTTPKTHSTSKFIRMVNDASGNPESLQTSITRYQGKDGLLVDLIGVIHIGERDYYRKLDKQFEQYESMLYELVAPENNRVPTRQAARKSNNPIHWMQSSMQRMLGLESQLQHIDYTKSNFVHADLSPRQMQQKMAERGDTVWSVGMRAFNEMMQKQSELGSSGQAGFGQDVESFEDLFGLLSNPAKLKRMLATQFASGGALEAGLGGSLNKILVEDRNQAAMEVLHREIGKGRTKLALFYGAAHMPDFEQRLVKELGLKKTRQAWVEAWDLQSAPSQESPMSGMADMFFQLIDSIDQ